MYNSYFGFSVPPFSVTPDPSFFYSNPVYQEAYANLRYGIEAKKGFIVITGEVGTGKTTLLRKLLMHNLEGTIQTVFVFNTYLNFTELLQQILYDLGLTPHESNNKVLLLQELNNYLISQLNQGHIVSVLVDEAQNLSDEALEGLRLLSNVETDEEKLIQIVLMGQPELHAKLDRPALRQLKQRIALQCRLIPLTEEEVDPYIDFRLRAAGYQGKNLFHPEAVRQITFYSNGIPRLVNIICDNALLCAFARSQKIVSADIINEVARDLRLVARGQCRRSAS
jgi:general secretion pathway protein A